MSHDAVAEMRKRRNKRTHQKPSSSAAGAPVDPTTRALVTVDGDEPLTTLDTAAIDEANAQAQIPDANEPAAAAAADAAEGDAADDAAPTADASAAADTADDSTAKTDDAADASVAAATSPGTDSADAADQPATPVAAAPAADFAVLHPLEYEWTFWYDKRNTAVGGGRRKGEMQHYETNLREIGDFGTVEDFWRYFHHIVKPTVMESNSNCHLFKKDIKPMWEDEHNANGGKWVVMVGKQDREALDAVWEGVVLSLVGETIGESPELCGAVCSVRKKADKIAVWTRTKTNESAIMEIGRNFQAILQAHGVGHLKLSYQYHDDALKSTTSYQNPARHRL